MAACNFPVREASKETNFVSRNQSRAKIRYPNSSSCYWKTMVCSLESSKKTMTKTKN
jgi:hypothetical protein